MSALRKIPMHGGGSDLAAGLNHVMRAPRGSESLSERVDFTPKGGREGREGKSKERGVRRDSSGPPIYPARVKKKGTKKSLVRSSYAVDMTRRTSESPGDPSFSSSGGTYMSLSE